jgi:hypothetical protein
VEMDEPLTDVSVLVQRTGKARQTHILTIIGTVPYVPTRARVLVHPLPICIQVTIKQTKYAAGRTASTTVAITPEQDHRFFDSKWRKAGLFGW